MANARVQLKDVTWRSTKIHAMTTNSTPSEVVQTALEQYLTNRSISTSAGSFTPSYTGATEPETVLSHTGGEMRIADNPSSREPSIGYSRPAPKPTAKKRGAVKGSGW